MTPDDIKRLIRDIPDFPMPGILFRDLTPLLSDATAFRNTLGLLESWAAEKKPTAIAAIEARGFIFGAPLAARMGVRFIPVRKPGKLPWRTLEESYALEYGASTLQMHADATQPGERVLLMDDLLATGGTAAAAVKLLRRAGASVVGALFVVELTALGGRELVDDVPMHALVSY